MIPGILYGRILVETSRKLTEAYNVAGNIAEQALSSIRTVYYFAGEERQWSSSPMRLMEL